MPRQPNGLAAIQERLDAVNDKLVRYARDDPRRAALRTEWNDLADQRRELRADAAAKAKAKALAELEHVDDEGLQAERDVVYAAFVEAKERLRVLTAEGERRAMARDAEASIAGLSDAGRAALRQTLQAEGIPSGEAHGFGTGGNGG